MALRSRTWGPRTVPPEYMDLLLATNANLDNLELYNREDNPLTYNVDVMRMRPYNEDDLFFGVRAETIQETAENRASLKFHWKTWAQAIQDTNWDTGIAGINTSTGIYYTDYIDEQEHVKPKAIFDVRCEYPVECQFYKPTRFQDIECTDLQVNEDLNCYGPVHFNNTSDDVTFLGPAVFEKTATTRDAVWYVTKHVVDGGKTSFALPIIDAVTDLHNNSCYMIENWYSANEHYLCKGKQLGLVDDTGMNLYQQLTLGTMGSMLTDFYNLKSFFYRHEEHPMGLGFESNISLDVPYAQNAGMAAPWYYPKHSNQVTPNRFDKDSLLSMAIFAIQQQKAEINDLAERISLLEGEVINEFPKEETAWNIAPLITDSWETIRGKWNCDALNNMNYHERLTSLFYQLGSIGWFTAH